jgi:GTP cyclohydrolase II
MDENPTSFSTQRFAATVLPIDSQGREILLNAYAYRGDSENEELLVLVHRNEELVDGTVPLVGVHLSCVTGDVFRSRRCDCYEQLQVALKTLCATEFGALVYLPHNHVGSIDLVKKLRFYSSQDQGDETVGATVASSAQIDARSYALVANALLQLGMHTIQLLPNSPAKAEVLSAFGLSATASAHLMNAPA